MADETLATQAVREGAQDFLVKGEVDSNLLVRSMRYSIERKRLEEQLAQSQKLEAIGRLAGGIAHDFNNLLTAITGFSDLGLSKLPPEDRVAAYLREIRGAAERAAKLTRQLLAFSRRQSRKPEILDLNDLILNLVTMLRRIIREDTELVTLVGEDIGLVRVDPGQFEQVLTNLVVNARDSMPDGGKLFIETAAVDLKEGASGWSPEMTRGTYSVITVRDTGTGMTEEVKRHIFEPFFTTKEVGKGTGLGLASTYGIVAQSGGSITVDSEPGNGTTFRIYLPQTGERIDGRSRPERRNMPTGTETVLVVEDEPMVRAMTAQVLVGQGYTVLEASNGVEAVSLAEVHVGEEIDLLFTDMVMPLLGGRQTARHISQMLPGIKVLYTSGFNGDTLDDLDALEPHGQFLPKPYTLAALASKVREVLDLKEQRLPQGQEGQT
jgi:signal transduction histidine kinase